ncbi:acetate--CoA ligase family protein (plasmid) [Neorhizobium galegae]|nr:acetate--CoA ligase family protein [Neorhizobium galegae]
MNYAAALAATKDRAPEGARIAKLPPPGLVVEYEGKRILTDLGIHIPKGALAKSADEAAKIATDIGYPVVMKAQAAELAHKSDVGASSSISPTSRRCGRRMKRCMPALPGTSRALSSTAC